MTLKVGLSFEVRTTVSAANMASAIGSGGVDVFSTPMMIALMEAASFQAVQPHLAPDESTVGTLINVRHLAATPGGMEVRAVSRLDAVEGKRLTFTVEAFDEKEKIGEGTHERFVVSLSRFIARVAQKGLS